MSETTKINYKDGYLTVAEFKAHRPDLKVHSDNTVQSAIYQACALLNNHTGGKIKAVWNYTKNTENPETTNALYRNEDELEYISEALIQQTQYIINSGNDLTVGSSSYSLAGATYSDSVPTSRNLIAPGVNEALAQARVYDFLVMGKSNDTNTPKYASDAFDPDTTYLTYSAGYKLFLQQIQPNALPGQVATIQTDNSTNQIVFTTPDKVELEKYSTTQEMLLTIQRAVDNLNLETYAKLTALEPINQSIDALQSMVDTNTSNITLLKKRVDNIEVNSGGGSGGSGVDLSNYVTNEALTTALANYLSTSGGTVNGNVNLNGNITTTNSEFRITVNSQPRKWITFYFDSSPTTGFRNWSGIRIMGKHEENEFTALQMVYRATPVQGMFWTVMNNLITFTEDTRITGIATPTSDSDVVNKSYVDSQANNLNTQVNNLNTQVNNVKNTVSNLDNTYMKKNQVLITTEANVTEDTTSWNTITGSSTLYSKLLSLSNVTGTIINAFISNIEVRATKKFEREWVNGSLQPVPSRPTLNTTNYPNKTTPSTTGMWLGSINIDNNSINVLSNSSFFVPITSTTTTGASNGTINTIIYRYLKITIKLLVMNASNVSTISLARTIEEDDGLTKLEVVDIKEL